MSVELIRLTNEPLFFFGSGGVMKSVSHNKGARVPARDSDEMYVVHLKKLANVRPESH